MNFRVFFAAIVGLAVSVYMVKILVGTGSAEMAKDPNMVTQKHIAPPPVAKKTGPQPKAFVPEFEFKFGRMGVGESRSHDFVIQNIGEGPLTIKMGKTTCQCTYADLKEGDERIIPPGQSQTVKLTWKPEYPTDQFSKGTEILTDDPDQDQNRIFLRVMGIVGTPVTVFPAAQWSCPDVLDDKPAVCVGSVASGILDDFHVLSIESRGVPMEFELAPLEGEHLERANRAKFGYEVKLKIKPDMQMGNFAFPITIKTDVPVTGEQVEPGKLAEFEVLVAGVRRGPIRFAGPGWVDEKMAVAMGNFEIAAGKEVVIPVFVRNAPAEGFQLTKPPEVMPPDLKVELIRGEKSEGKSQRSSLKVSYPPGAPRVEHRVMNPGTIHLWTNHPDAPEMEILVYLISH